MHSKYKKLAEVEAARGTAASIERIEKALGLADGEDGKGRKAPASSVEKKIDKLQKSVDALAKSLAGMSPSPGPGPAPAFEDDEAAEGDETPE